MLPERVQQVRGISILLDEETAKVLDYSAQTAISRMGKHVIRRKRGASMGSPLSPAKSGLVYREHECNLLRDDPWEACGLSHLRALGLLP